MEWMAIIPRGECSWDDDAFERYSMGQLPQDETEPLEEHLLVCEACRTRLRQQDEVIARIRRAAVLHRRETPVRQAGIRVFPRLVPLLAGFAILLVMGVVSLRWIRPGAVSPTFPVKLEALRGSTPGAQAPAGRPLAIEADLSGLPPVAYRLELVDRDGRAVWKGAAPSASVPPLEAGAYFLRVYGEDGRLLREFGLDVQAPRR